MTSNIMRAKYEAPCQQHRPGFSSVLRLLCSQECRSPNRHSPFSRPAFSIRRRLVTSIQRHPPSSNVILCRNAPCEPRSSMISVSQWICRLQPSENCSLYEYYFICFCLRNHTYVKKILTRARTDFSDKNIPAFGVALFVVVSDWLVWIAFDRRKLNAADDTSLPLWSSWWAP